MNQISANLYVKARDWLLVNDPDGQPMFDWASRDLKRPETPEKLAAEVIWIILCAGRLAQAARTIEKKVWKAINAGQPVVEVFGYKKKAEAIERAWHERNSDFTALAEIALNNIEELLEWCQAIPFVGVDTKYQLAKNWGSDVCKPDIWLCRLSGIPDHPRKPVIERFRRCQSVCVAISAQTGDRVAIIDSILWLACNKGVLSVEPTAGGVHFTPPDNLRVRPILVQTDTDGDLHAQQDFFGYGS